MLKKKPPLLLVFSLGKLGMGLGLVLRVGLGLGSDSGLGLNFGFFGIWGRGKISALPGKSL